MRVVAASDHPSDAAGEHGLLPVAGSPMGEVSVRLSLDLLQAARVRAEDESLTLDRWIEHTLQAALDRGPRAHLPTVAGDGLAPGADVTDLAALIDLMERPDAAA
jgi:hypothetical protein